MVGAEIRVEQFTERFGRQTSWQDDSRTLPTGQISVLLGPSGTDTSGLLKTLIWPFLIATHDINTAKVAKLTRSRLEMTLVRVGADWLVSGVKPL